MQLTPGRRLGIDKVLAALNAPRRALRKRISLMRPCLTAGALSSPGKVLPSSGVSSAATHGCVILTRSQPLSSSRSMPKMPGHEPCHDGIAWRSHSPNSKPSWLKVSI